MKESDGDWIARMRDRGLVAEALLDLYPSLVKYARRQGYVHAWRTERGGAVRA